MKDNTKTFFELLSKDEELRKKVCAMTELEEIITLARELGIELTEADFEAPEGELSEDELNTVAGGGDCLCIIGGGGTEGNVDNVCACVLVGVGCFTGTAYDGSISDDLQRCGCQCYGEGNSRD